MTEEQPSDAEVSAIVADPEAAGLLTVGFDAQGGETWTLTAKGAQVATQMAMSSEDDDLAMFTALLDAAEADTSVRKLRGVKVPEPLIVSWQGREVRVRHDDPHLGPYTPRGAVIRSAIELASDVEGLRLALLTTVGDRYRVRVGDDGSVVGLWRSATYLRDVPGRHADGALPLPQRARPAYPGP